MSLEEDINKIEKKAEKMSVAMEMLQFAKDQNKILEKNNERQHKIIKMLIWTIIGLVILLCVSVGYTIYILNDTSVVELDDDTIEIQDVETIDNSHIKIGDDIWEKSKLQNEE